MKIQFLENIRYRLDADRTIRLLRSVRADAESESSEELRLAVIRWAGDIGEPLRKPSGSGFESVESSRVVAIDCVPDGERSFLIHYEALLEQVEPQESADAVYRIDGFGEETFQRSYRLSSSTIGETLPVNGGIVEAFGKAFRCTETELKQNLDGTYLYRITCRTFSQRIAVPVEYRATSDYTIVKTITYEVSATELDAFLAGHQNNSPADWAGNEFYQIACRSIAVDAFTYRVTLEARQIQVTCLEICRRERFLGRTSLGVPRREIRYIGRWRVHADARSTFENLTGGSPAAWAGVNGVVLSISSRKINDSEYEYTLEAGARGSCRLDVRGNEHQDDRSALKTRQDYAVRGVFEFRLSPQDAGYFYYKNELIPMNEEYPGSWISELHCPFLFTGNAMDWTEVGKIYRCLEVEYVRYLSGGPAGNVTQAITYFNANNVFVGSLAGYIGSWRCRDRKLNAVYDNDGNLFSRLTERWLLAPGSWYWNPAYFNGRA